MLETTISHVRKNDIVQVKVGKDRGKTGKVLRVVTKTGKVVVEKINVLKRHTKPTGKAPGGIVEKEGPIAVSNVLLYCEKCGKGVRTVRKVLANGKKARSCRKCSTQLDK
jgi:large subunit ribosomal protein L24